MGTTSSQIRIQNAAAEAAAKAKRDAEAAAAAKKAADEAAKKAVVHRTFESTPPPLPKIEKFSTFESFDTQTPPNIFDLEKAVFSNLNIFNASYAKFVRCNTTVNIKIDKTTDCPGTITDDLTTASANLNESIDNLTKALTEVNASRTTSEYIVGQPNKVDRVGPDGISPDEYNKRYKDLGNFYDNLTKLRAELDLKMKDLSNDNESISQTYNDKLNATIYASAVWTVLASSLVYYVFVKM
jgi:hypothetical protein